MAGEREGVAPGRASARAPSSPAAPAARRKAIPRRMATAPPSAATSTDMGGLLAFRDADGSTLRLLARLYAGCQCRPRAAPRCATKRQQIENQTGGFSPRALGRCTDLHMSATFSARGRSSPSTGGRHLATRGWHALSTLNLRRPVDCSRRYAALASADSCEPHEASPPRDPRPRSDPAGPATPRAARETRLASGGRRVLRMARLQSASDAASALSRRGPRGVSTDDLPAHARARVRPARRSDGGDSRARVGSHALGTLSVHARVRSRRMGRAAENGAGRPRAERGGQGDGRALPHEARPRADPARRAGSSRPNADREARGALPVSFAVVLL